MIICYNATIFSFLISSANCSATLLLESCNCLLYWSIHFHLVPYLIYTQNICISFFDDEENILCFLYVKNSEVKLLMQKDDKVFFAYVRSFSSFLPSFLLSVPYSFPPFLPCFPLICPFFPQMNIIFKKSDTAQSPSLEIQSYLKW